MASTISAGTTTTTALVYTADTSGVLQLQTNGTTTAVTIGTNQYVGIGTTSPSYPLSVNGQIASLTGGVAAYGLTNSDTISNQLYLQNSGATKAANFQIGSSGVLQTWVYGGSSWVNATTIDASGNLGLATTPSAWGSGSHAMQIIRGGFWHDGSAYFSMNNNAYYNGSNWIYINSSSAYASNYAQVNGAHEWFTAPTGTSGNTVSFTQAMTLSNAGTLTVPVEVIAGTYAATAMSSGSGSNVVINLGSGGFYYATSALKYKTNVRDLPSIDINKFRPIVYNSNLPHDDSSIDYFGFIADEVDLAGYKQLVNYKNGEVEGFQYERMVVVLTKALQELSAQVTTLQSQVAALTPKA